MKRRELLRAGMYSIGIGATGILPVPSLFARAAQSLAAQGSGQTLKMPLSPPVTLTHWNAIDQTICANAKVSMAK